MESWMWGVLIVLAVVMLGLGVGWWFNHRYWQKLQRAAQEHKEEIANKEEVSVASSASWVDDRSRDAEEAGRILAQTHGDGELTRKAKEAVQRLARAGTMVTIARRNKEAAEFEREASQLEREARGESAVEDTGSRRTPRTQVSSSLSLPEQVVTIRVVTDPSGSSAFSRGGQYPGSIREGGERKPPSAIFQAGLDFAKTTPFHDTVEASAKAQVDYKGNPAGAAEFMRGFHKGVSLRSSQSEGGESPTQQGEKTPPGKSAADAITES